MEISETLELVCKVTA